MNCEMRKDEYENIIIRVKYDLLTNVNLCLTCYLNRSIRLLVLIVPYNR